MSGTRYSIGWGTGFSDAYRDLLIRAWEDHYGLNPEHPGQFFNDETQEWVDIPLKFPEIYNESI